MKSWTVAIKDIQKLPEKVVRGTVFSMFSNIVEATPVGNTKLWKSLESTKKGADEGTRRKGPKGYVGGTLRGNWQIGVGAAPTDKKEPDPSGVTAVSGGLSAINGAEMGKSIYITNNMPYAERVEYGWSSQNKGFVRREMQALQTRLEEAVKKL